MLLNAFGPILLLIGVWIYFMRQMQGGGAGGRGAMSFGKSKCADAWVPIRSRPHFNDVAGVEEAKAGSVGTGGLPEGSGQVPEARRQAFRAAC